MKKYFAFLTLFFLMIQIGLSQDKFVIEGKRKTDRINFKLINNLIIIPVDVNGVTLSFLLDTGVSKPIIFNFLNVSDTLKIKNTETIYLRGLGEGEPVEALKSKNNIFKIGDAIKLNQDLFAIYNSNLNLAPRLGIAVHGIIGFDIFKDFIVEINYGSKYLRLTEPDYYKYKPCKSCEQFNLEYHNNKPYISAKVVISEKKIPVKLLIDSGGSDSLWLFEDDSLGIESNSKFFYDFLGHGLNGSVYGKRSRLEGLYLKSFHIKNSNVSYPDWKSVFLAQKIKDRNGSLAGNILKRFNIILDYQRNLITLKKNKYFKEPFSYNRSGIELAHEGSRLVREIDKSVIRNDKLIRSNSNTDKSIRVDGIVNYRMMLKPAFVIVELRENSPAARAGLKIGDLILTINNKGTHDYSLQQIIQKFYGEVNKRIKLSVQRDGRVLTFSFKLEKFF
jgi:hypothetical protein